MLSQFGGNAMVAQRRRFCRKRDRREPPQKYQRGYSAENVLLSSQFRLRGVREFSPVLFALLSQPHASAPSYWSGWCPPG